MTWRFGPVHSQVRWTGTYLDVLTITGLFTDVHATLRLEGQDVSDWSVEATIVAASLSSGNALRDDILRGPDFLDVGRFPLITFRSTSVQRADTHYRVSGELTMHGATRGVVLDLRDRGELVDWLGLRSRVLTAETTLNRTDFQVGLPPGELTRVAADVRVALQVELLWKDPVLEMVGPGGLATPASTLPTVAAASWRPLDKAS
jgi:polyisoprenoid-binding protein YceI